MAQLYQTKTDNICKIEDVKARFDTSNYEFDRSLPKGKTKKGYWLSKIWIRQGNYEWVCWIKSKNL